MNRIIVGLGHRRRVGKDCLCAFLHDQLAELGISSRRVALADKLKDVCHQLYGWAGLQPAWFYEDMPAAREKVLPALGMTPRQVWIDFGTRAIRDNFYPNTWIDYLTHTASKGAVNVVIVPDVRFPNEAQRIKDAGGLLVLVARPGIEQHSDAADSALVDYRGWDFIIENRGTLDDLKAEAKGLAVNVIRALMSVAPSTADEPDEDEDEEDAPGPEL